MRLLGKLDGDQAVVFASFLLVKGIETQLFPEDNGEAEVWAKDEDQFDLALAELEKYRSNPAADEYSGAIKKAKSIAQAEEKRRRAIQKKIVNVRTITDKKPRLTLILMGICVFVALFTNFGDRETTPRDHVIYKALQFTYIGQPTLDKLMPTWKSTDDLSFRMASLIRGEVWRTVTPIFIHYGIFHIVFNMMWFFQFGKMIENRYGWKKFALLILATAVISNIAQCTVPVSIGGSRPGTLGDGNTLITALGGMSGVIYGLFGFIWMKSIYDRKSGMRISDGVILWMIIWLFFCMIPPRLFAQVLPFTLPSVGNWAHGVGLLIGMAIGYGTSILRNK